MASAPPQDSQAQAWPEGIGGVGMVLGTFRRTDTGKAKDLALGITSSERSLCFVRSSRGPGKHLGGARVDVQDHCCFCCYATAATTLLRCLLVCAALVAKHSQPSSIVSDVVKLEA